MIHKARNHFRIGALVAVLSAATTVCGLAQTTQTTQGSIAGTIYGPDGKALRGTKVWANIVSPVARPVDRNSSIVPVLSTVTARDGRFALPFVPDGDYVLCASNGAAAALNPCTWGGATLVKIANGQQAPGQAIRMAAGATLQVHLDDPGGLLSAAANKPGASLIIGLAGPYGFVPLPIAGSTANSLDYQVLVPFNTTHTVMVSTQYFKLTNAAGGAISAGSSSIPVTITSGMPAQVINLRIVGAGN
jgi:hypothetical protein